VAREDASRKTRSAKPRKTQKKKSGSVETAS
jgi:hypothetical protein